MYHVPFIFNWQISKFLNQWGKWSTSWRMEKEKFENIIYLLLLFFLPTQFGKHFWPSFALVNGLRLDYLSPTLYLTDILILLLLSLHVFQRLFSLQGFRPCLPAGRYSIFGFLMIVIILLGIVFSKQPLSGLYGLLKLLEMTFFAWYTAAALGKTVSFVQAGLAISASLLFESLLGIAQFISHGSLGGIFYFFGERSFTMLTPGIANSSIHGTLILRPYGTLPHPNVLAGFLLFSMLFVIGQWEFLKRWQKRFIAVSLFVSLIALFLTLSRIPILWFFLLFFIGIVWIIRKKKKTLRVGLRIVGLVGVVTILTPLGSRFLSTSFGEEAFIIREDLALNALWMIQTHPLVGVGWQNFLYNLPKTATTFAYYTQIQPVHNIYLLLFAQLGIVGGLVVVGGLGYTIRRIVTAIHSPARSASLFMFLSILFLGLFDHYFLTLQSGQLLFALIIGLCYSLPQHKVKKKQFSK